MVSAGFPRVIRGNVQCRFSIWTQEIHHTLSQPILLMVCGTYQHLPEVCGTRSCGCYPGPSADVRRTGQHDRFLFVWLSDNWSLCRSPSPHIRYLVAWYHDRANRRIQRCFACAWMKAVLALLYVDCQGHRLARCAGTVLGRSTNKWHSSNVHTNWLTTDSLSDSPLVLNFRARNPPALLMNQCLNVSGLRHPGFGRLPTSPPHSRRISVRYPGYARSSSLHWNYKVLSVYTKTLVHHSSLTKPVPCAAFFICSHFWSLKMPFPAC